MPTQCTTLSDSEIDAACDFICRAQLSQQSLTQAYVRQSPAFKSVTCVTTALAMHAKTRHDNAFEYVEHDRAIQVRINVARLLQDSRDNESMSTCKFKPGYQRVRCSRNQALLTVVVPKQSTQQIAKSAALGI